MLRIVWLLAGVLLVVLSLGSGAPKGYDGTVAWKDGLQGTWHTVAGEIGGERVLLVADADQTFRAGKWYVSSNSEGTYTTDESYRPAYLDKRFPATGELRKYIYRVDGDTLWIGCMPDGCNRPTSFDDKGICVVIWKRVKQD